MSLKKLDINKSIERELAEPKVPGKKPVPGQSASSDEEKKCEDSEITGANAALDSFLSEYSETEEECQPVPDPDEAEAPEEKDAKVTAQDFPESAQEKTSDDFTGQSHENEAVLKEYNLLPNILPGISGDVVLENLGQPDELFEWYTGQIRLKYGEAWVIIENSVVTCLFNHQKYEKFWGRKKYESFAPEAIIR